MAEAAPSSQNSPPTTPTPLPEPDLDVLLSQLPQFKDSFGEPAAQSGNADPDSPDPNDDATATGAGLDAAVPVEEEPVITDPAETEPTEDEPEPEPEPQEPDAVQKRINKLTAQRKSAEDQVNVLRAEITELKAKAIAPPPVAPTPASPLSDVDSPAELQKRHDLAQQAKTWAIENLDGGDVDMGEGKTQYLDGSQVKKLLAKAETMLTQAIPQRAQYLNLKNQFDSEATKAYPALFKAGSEEQKEYSSWLTVFPECRRYPDIALIVGDAITGRKMRLARSQKTQQKGNGQSPPLAVPQPAAAARIQKSRALSEEELSAIATDSSGHALDKFVDQLIDSGQAARVAANASRQRSQR